MSVSEDIRLHYPLPIAKLYEAVRLEDEPRQRVRKLVDLFECTAQYLVLVGLAGYGQAGLSDPRVEELRPGLAQPSLGHWVGLLKALGQALRPRDPPLLTADPGHVYRDDPIAAAAQSLADRAGLQLPKKVMLHHFLDALVEFRNKKIGHGVLSPAEASQVSQPLEEALTQWLGDLSTLRERHLVHIARVEWITPHFVYSGTSLNTGASLYPVRLEGSQGIDHDRVYLHQTATNDLLPLYPFFAYNGDTHLVYLYGELSVQGKPLLKCPFEAPGAQATYSLDLDASSIVGAGRIPDLPAAARDAEEPRAAPAVIKTRDYTPMRNWFDIITPHADIRRGGFDKAIFAADLGDVESGHAPDDYRNPYLFFKKTYPTQGLKNLLAQVYNTLTAGHGPSVIQIQTPSGGGKTHALVAIYHYLKHGPRVKELLPAGLELPVVSPAEPHVVSPAEPLAPRVTAIAGNHLNPLQGRTSDGVTRFTFWGEVAYQIGGQAGYEAFRQNDEARISPGKDKLLEFLSAHQPFILLFDEVLEYINRALDARARGDLDVSLGTQTFSFFQELTEAVAVLPRGMLVVTLPSSHLEDFGEQQEESLARLGKIFGRLESIETPVQGEEVYAVIRRRLFEEEDLRRIDMREVVHSYSQLYQQYRDDLPPRARDVNYREKMELAYPFHPDVVDILYEKWSTFPSFQRTRGVLRLLANVVEDLYQRELNLDLILPGDINLGRPGVRYEFLKHIGSEYDGVIGSDIAGHEAKAQAMDAANRPWKHLAQRVATAVFFHSFSADDSEKGISLPYIKLATMHGDTIPALVTDVLSKLGNELWYLNSRADAYYFSRIPNLNRMILDKKELFNETYAAELRKIVEAEIGPKFRPYLWPESGEGIPDNRELKLVILRPDDSGMHIPDWIERRGASFREYQNTLFFALADTAAFAKLREDVKTYLALGEIKSELDAGQSPLLEAKRDEIQRRLRDIQRDFSFNVRRMYHSLHIGARRVDLGQPVAGSETLSTWYWRELTSMDIGAIVTQLHYRILANKLMAGYEVLSAALILDQFYKNPGLPAPAEPGVVARALQLGVKDGAFGLAELRGEDVDPATLKYKADVPLDAISFEPGIYLVSQPKCEDLLAQQMVVKEGELGVEAAETITLVDTATVRVDEGTPEPGGVAPAEQRFKRVRLVVGDIPASKIADVNRGILMPLSGAVGEFKFTLEIDVSSAEGISQSTLENKIKETIRQIGATLQDERLE